MLHRNQRTAPQLARCARSADGLAHRGISLFDIPGLHRIRKGFGSRRQVCRLFGNVRLIGGDCIAQAQHRSAFRRIGRGISLDDGLPAGLVQQTAESSHTRPAPRLAVIFWLKPGAIFHALPRPERLFQDLPLQRLLAVVLNNKLGFTAVHREGHRLTLLVVDRHLNLWNIRSLRRRRQATSAAMPACNALRRN